MQEDVEYGGSEMRAAGFKGGKSFAVAIMVLHVCIRM